VRAAVAALAVASVWAAAPAWGSGRLTVMTSTTDLASLVDAVAGDRAHVESLAPPAHDPHAFEVKPGQLARLRAVDLLVRIGLDHEPWLDRAVAALGDRRLARGGAHALEVAPVVELLQTETPRVRTERGVHVHGFGNTHVWLDPENARPITAAIEEALVRLRPDDRGLFAVNRARFLAALDAGLKRWTSALTGARGERVVVVHETWPYFARRFGLVVVAAVEPTPGVPPSPAALRTLEQRMRDAGVKIVIAEPYASAGLVNQIATVTGARAVTLVPSVGGDPAARDYLSLFDVNVGRLAAVVGPR
jgi:ABC-type Zn uptake system ZnuABC Zn-binding protein ZnuA